MNILRAFDRMRLRNISAVEANLVIVAFLLISAIFLTRHRHPIKVTPLEGRYENRCCPTITIGNDHLEFDNHIYPIRFRLEKGEITGDVETQLGRKSVSRSSTAIAFHPEHNPKDLSTLVDGESYVFLAKK